MVSREVASGVFGTIPIDSILRVLSVGNRRTLLGPHLAKRKVLFRTDNEAVVQIIDK